MDPRRCSEAADRAGAVMAGGRTTIGTGQHKNSIGTEGLQSGLDQGTGMAESIQINQIEAPPLELGSHNNRSAETLLQVAAATGPGRPRASIAIGIIHQDLRWQRITTQPPAPAQPPDTASGHQIATGGVVRGLLIGLDTRPAAPNNPLPAGSRRRSRR